MLRVMMMSMAVLLSVLPAQADETAVFAIGADRYLAGESVRLQTEGPVQDVFLAGQSVSVLSEVGGSAHVMARKLEISAPVAGDLFGAGMSVEVTAPVGGDATLAGYEVTASGAVGGNLRAAGTEVEVGGPVAGYALLAADELRLNGTIGGDAVLAAGAVEFGSGAAVAGMLTVYVDDPDAFVVPESVAPAARVVVRPMEDYKAGDMARGMPMRPSFGRLVGWFLGGVLMSGLFAAAVIAVAPRAVQSWRELALAHPWRAMLSGFLAVSVLAGSGIVLALTLVGLLLTPFLFVLTGLVLFAGYALGSYVLGVGLWLLAGRTMPEELPGKFGLACLGAFVAGLAWAVPVIGWLFVMGLTLIGVGTLAAFVLPRDLMLRRDATGY